ncbi:MAG: AAA family ATPase [Eggerthellaceae bacterium]|nr:AAA family ATPase [Eggerthellaceae bacterium]
MDIREAKQQVKDSVEAYLARDDAGLFRIPPAEQRPLFLLGAPGIGKTAVVAQVANELGIGLVSYSMTHHTRQSALGLPLIVHRTYRSGAEFDISEYTMSEIIASIYDYMEDTELESGILFLDEINCVSETLYPSMLQFLQFKTFGRHAVPSGWVVVCAGNPPEYNRNVHEFDIVTMDRLRRVEVEPSLEAWQAYARERGVHPAITSYLEVHPDDFYLVESTPAGKQFVSARSWSELSSLLTLLEDLCKPIGSNVIEQYVQHPEIASRFTAYYELFAKYRSDYQIEAILAGRAPADIIARAKAAPFDERLALLSLLLDATSAKMRNVLIRNDALTCVRNELRRAKGSEHAGKKLALAATAIAKKSEDTAGSANPEDARSTALAAVLLHDFALMEDFEQVADAYSQQVGALEEHTNDASSALESAYAFVDEAFGTLREALVFTTELTARRDTARFIARFGSDAYHKHSAMLATDTERDAIFEEIDALRA